MNIYLAGPVFTPEDDGKGWRDYVKDEMHQRGYYWLDPTEEISADRAMEMDPEVLVEHDKEMIRDADALLVGYSHVLSIGTWREVEFAKSVLGLPVAVWLGPCEEDQITLSPWVHEAGEVTESLDDCLEYIDERGNHV